MLQKLISSVFESPFLTVVIILVTYLVTEVIRRDRQFKFYFGRIPGPPAVPVLGNSLSLIGTLEHIFKQLEQWTREYGRRFTFRAGLNYWVLNVSNADDMEKFLKSHDEITKSPEYDRIIPWLGTGVLTATGQKWHNRRKMLTPAFHFSILEPFTVVLNEEAKVLVNIWKSKYSDGEIFDAFPYMTRVALDSICETAMGEQINCQSSEDQPYLNAVCRLTYIQQYRAMRPWFHPATIWKLSPYGREETRLIKTVHDFTDSVIQKRKKERQSSNVDEKQNDLPETDVYMTRKKRLAFLDLMLEYQVQSNGVFTDADIREETDTIMFAGHDTTTSAMSFMLYCLGRNPDVQEKLYQELNDVVGQDKNLNLTTEHLKELKYLDCCMKETLRIFPSVPFIGRTLQNNFQLDETLTIPKGSNILLDIFQLHRDEKYFPNPLKYDPERFSLSSATGRHPFAYLPFSAGLRNCIGQKFAQNEVKIVVAHVIRNFEIDAVDSYEDLHLFPSLVLRPETGVRIKLKPRK